MKTPEPVELELSGGSIQLVPLSPDRAEAFLDVANAPGVWSVLPTSPPATIAEAADIIARSLAASRSTPPTEIPFAVIRRTDGRFLGSTRYLDIQIPNHALEIGWTFYHPDAQRTSVNTECKLLLLRHAFEVLGCVRVQFKTDARNTRSQNAILRLGAQYEGRLRKHRVVRDGFIRDTVYFSIIKDEWPGVEARLSRLLAAPRV